MDGADAGRNRLKPRHALAGLEAGVLGAIYMTLWLMLGSRLAGRSVWDIPNLFATTFYGSLAYQGRFLHSSWSGFALILAICGLGGMLWGLVWRDDRQSFLTLFGAVAGLALYFLLFDLIWKRVNPIIPMYAPLRELQIGYIVWGMALARAPRYSRAIATLNGVPPEAFERGGAVSASREAGHEEVRR